MNFRREKFYVATFYPLGLTTFSLDSFERCVVAAGARYADRDSLGLPYFAYNDTDVEVESADENDPICVRGKSTLRVKVAELGYGSIIQSEVAKICSHFNVEFRGTMEILFVKI